MNKTLLFFLFFTSHLFCQAQTKSDIKHIVQGPAAIKPLYGGDTLVGFDMLQVLEKGLKRHLNSIEMEWFVQGNMKLFMLQKFQLPIPAPQDTIDPLSFVMQTSACNNVDFENGDYSAWVGAVGYNQNSNAALTVTAAGINTLGIDSPEPSCSYHTLVTKGNDPYGGFSMRSTGGFSLRLGGENINQYKYNGCTSGGGGGVVNAYSGGESIQQTYTVTAANALLTYNYAVVLNDGGHANGEQPYFSISVLDGSGNPIPCFQYYQQIAAGTVPAGYKLANQTSPVDGTNVYYLPWTSNSLNMSAYIGQTLTIKFTAAGCVGGAHFGYAYLDASCSQLQIVTKSNGNATGLCAGSQDTLYAPAGGASYKWGTLPPGGSGIVGATNNQQVVVNQNGSYQVTVTTTTGCTYTVSTTLNPVPAPTPDFSYVAGCSNALTKFTDTSTPSGQTTAWAWDFDNNGTWDSNVQNPSYTFPATGTYPVKFRATLPGCSATIIKNVSITKQGPSINTSTTNATCVSSDGSATAAASGGVGPYTYLWSGGSYAGCANIAGPCTTSNLGANTYTVSVTDNQGCKATASATVVKAGATTISISPTPTICAGTQVTLTANATPCPAGTYTVTMANNNTYPIPQNGCNPSWTGKSTNQSPGSSPITYSCLNPNSWNIVKLCMNIYTQGTYGVQDVSIMLQAPDGTVKYLAAGPFGPQSGCDNLSGNNFTNTCFSNGGGAIDASSAPYSGTYHPNDGGCAFVGCGQAAANFNCLSSTAGIDPNGTWYLNVGDYSGGANTDPNFKILDWTMTLQSTNAIKSYQWSTGPNTAALTVAPTQTTTYFVTVTDYACHTFDQSVVVYVNPLPVVDVSNIKHVSCFGGNDAYAVADVTTGTAPYNYTWSGGSYTGCTGTVGNCIDRNLIAGTYTVIATDATGCGATGVATITQPSAPSANAGPDLNSCYPSTFSLSGNIAAGYTASWTIVSGGAGSFANANAASTNFTPSAPGSYTLRLSAISGTCTPVFDDVLINAIQPLLSVSPTLINYCKGGSAAITGNASTTGSAPKQTSFTNNTSTTVTNNLPAGSNSTIAVSGISPASNNPPVSVCVNISEPRDRDLAIYLTCPGGTKIRLSGGNGGTGANYTNTCFQLSGGSPISTGTAPFTGSYQPEQSLSNFTSCTDNGNWVLNVKDTVAAGGTPITINSWSITFNNNIANTITSYVWTPNTAITSTNTLNTTVSPSLTTTYTLVATDLLGCTANAKVPVIVNIPPTALISATQVTCYAAANGAVSAQASGGSGLYNYTWNNGISACNNISTNCLKSNLAPNTYIVTVSDANSCFTTASISITQPSAITGVISASHVSCNGAASGRAQISPSGGAGGFSYLWNTIPTQNTQTASNLAAGTYQVTVSDANSCQTILSVTITQAAAIAPPTVGSPSICAGSTASLNVSAPATGTFSWFNVSTGGSALFTGNPFTTPTLASTTSYYVQVTTAGGCTSSRTMSVVTVNPIPGASFNIVPNVICVGTNANVTYSGTSGAGAAYTWNFAGGTASPGSGQGPHTVSWAASGTKTVSLQVAENACNSPTATYAVTVTPLDNPAFSYSPNSYCQLGGATPSLSISTSGGTFTGPAGLASFNASNGTFNVAASAVGSYTVTYTTAGPCPSFSTSVVNVISSPSADFSYADPYCKGGGTVNPTMASGATKGTFTASPALAGLNSVSGAVDLNTAGSGTYIIKNSVTISGCAASATYALVIKPQPTVSYTSISPICSGASTDITISATSISGSTFDWTVNAGSISGASAGGPINVGDKITQSLVNTSSSIQAATYIISPKGPGLPSCPGVSATVVIDVKPLPTFVVQGAPETVCSGSATSSTSLVSSYAGIAYTWSATTGGSSGSGANFASGSLNNAGSTISTITYTVSASLSSCPGSTKTFIVDVNPVPKVTLSADNNPICSGASANITLTGNAASTQLDWVSTLNNLTFSGAGSGSASATGTISGFYTLVSPSLAGSASFTVSPKIGTCTGVAAAIVISVKPTPILNTITSPTICSGQSTAISLGANTGAGTTFSWISSDGGSGVNGHSAGSGSAINQNLSHNQTTGQTVSYTITPTFNNCVGLARVVEVLVNPIPIASFTINPQNICAGQNATYTYAGTPGISSYTWNSDGGSAMTGAGPGTISWATGGTKNPSLSVSKDNCTSSVYSIPVTVTPFIDPAFNYSPNQFCSTDADPSPVLVNSGGTFTAAPAGLVFNASNGKINIASSSPGSYSVSYTIGGVCPSFAVQTVKIILAPNADFSLAGPYCAGAGTISPTLASGAGSGTFSGSPAGLSINSSTGDIDLNASSAGTFTVSNSISASCGTATKSVTIVVNPKPTVNPGSAVVCSATALNINITGTGASYNWTLAKPANVNVTANPAPPGTKIQDVLSLTNASAAVVTYTITPIGAGSTACPGTSVAYMVTVNPIPSLSFTNNKPEICSGQSTDIALMSDVAGATFTWQAQAGSGISGHSNGSGASPINQNLSNSSGNAAVCTYTFSASYQSCVSNPQSTQLTVNSVPGIVVSSLGKICSGTGYSISVSSANPGVSVSWTADASAKAGGATDGSGSLPLTITGTINTTSPIVATYTIVPASGGSVTCANAPVYATVTIVPKPVAGTLSASQTVCTGQQAADIVLSGFSGNITWEKSVDGTNWQSQVGSTASYSPAVIINNSSTASFVYFRATVVNGSCAAQSSNTVTITINPGAIAGTLNKAQTICKGATPGALTLGGSLGSLQWQDSPDGVSYTDISGQTTATYLPPALNSDKYYRVKVSVGSCPPIYSNDIHISIEDFKVTVNSKGIPCFGDQSATATAVVSGGTASSYKWSDGQQGVVASNLSVGSYAVTVSSSNACSAQANTTIASPPELKIDAVNVLKNASCGGYNDGEIEINASGGTAPITVKWSNGATGVANPSFKSSSFAAGAYAVTVSDANTCSKISNATITEPANISFSTIIKKEACNQSNGEIFLTVNNASGTLNYAWPANVTMVVSNGTGSTAKGLSTGNYAVTVTYGTGCKKDTTINVAPEGGPSVSVNTVGTPASQNNGSATAIGTGGTSPYQYTWYKGATKLAGPATSNTINSLAIGTDYKVQITDAAGCVSETPFSIKEFSISFNTTAAKCYGQNNGSISTTVTGNIGTVNYKWSNGATSPNLNAVAAGTYYVTITDGGNGAIATDFTIVSQPTDIVLNLSKLNATCNAMSNGSASVIVLDENGNAQTATNYIYVWQSNASTTASATGYGKGNYTVTVSTLNGACFKTENFVIAEPSPLKDNATVKASNCSNDGSITLTPSGGSGAYDYAWSNGATTKAITGLKGPGTYLVTVSDAAASTCYKIFTNNLTDIGSPVIARVDTLRASIFGKCTGVATVSITTGTGNSPYYFEWSDKPGIINTQNKRTDFCAGSYTVSVYGSVAGQQNKNCFDQKVFIIKQAPQLGVLASSISAPCFQSTGTLVETGFGGIPPYKINWFDLSNKAVSNANAVAAGTYIAVISDAAGATASASTEVLQPTEITINIQNNNVKCFGAHTGSAIATASGGSPDPVFKYKYFWSNNPANDDSTASGLVANTKYTVSVSDANACLKTAATSLTQATELKLNPQVSDASCFNTCDGTITANAAGGVLNYNYNWAGPSTVASIPFATALCKGTYTITVSDANQCTASATAIVNSPPLLTASIDPANVVHVKCFGESNASANVTVSGGLPPITKYLWSNNTSNSQLQNVGAATYTVTVIDTKACTAISSIIITQPLLFTNTPLASSATLCINGSYVPIISPAGGTGPYTHQWQSNPGIQILSAATISPTAIVSNANTVLTVISTDSRGCSAQSNINLRVLPPLNVDVNSLDKICEGQNISLSATASGGNGNYNYKWTANPPVAWPNNLSVFSGVLNSAVVTSFYLNISDACSTPSLAYGPKLVNVYAKPPADFTFSPDKQCEPMTIQFSAGKAPDGSIYTWDFGNGKSYSSTNANDAASVYLYNTGNSGVFPVQLKVTLPSSMNSCFNNASPKDVQVMQRPIADFDFSPQLITNLNPSVVFNNRSIPLAKIKSSFWNFGDNQFSSETDPNHFYNAASNYDVTLVVMLQTAAVSCFDTTSRQVVVGEDFACWIPDAFSPNDDGLNDVFVVKGIGIASVEMSIFDRWGNQVFFSKDLQKGWDGTSNQSKQLAQQDVYAYVISVWDYKNKVHIFKGKLSLIR